MGPLPEAHKFICVALPFVAACSGVAYVQRLPPEESDLLLENPSVLHDRNRIDFLSIVHLCTIGFSIGEFSIGQTPCTIGRPKPQAATVRYKQGEK
jgi:hypothetical protein